MGRARMRYAVSEKLEIIQLVQQSHLSARRTLARLGIPRTTFYRWYDRSLAAFGWLDSLGLIWRFLDQIRQTSDTHRAIDRSWISQSQNSGRLCVHYRSSRHAEAL